MSHEITTMNLIGISIAIIGYIISILEYTKEPIFSIRLIAILFLSTLALVITIWDLHVQENEKRASSHSGTISSSCNTIYPCIIFGGNIIKGSPDGISVVDLTKGFSMGVRERKIGESVIQNDSNNKILIWVDKGQLKASVTIKDRDGKKLAGIIGNEWDTAQKPIIYDRNFDNSGLEVIDAYGQVVFQADLGKPCARVCGVFYNNLGTIIINNSGVLINPSENTKIDPIFVYPSEKHLGERVRK